MNTLTQGLLARRKIVLIFILAILFPALVLGYLSLSAFSKRREAVRKLLESNLWISGESALRAVEAALIDREKSVLDADNFAVLGLRGHDPAVDPSHTGAATSAAEIPGTPFLLDQEFHILLPRTGSGKPDYFPAVEPSQESKFSKVFQRAEIYEFSQRDFVKAAQTYKESAALTLSDGNKAAAMSSQGRCLISAGRLKEARRLYCELGEKYGAIRDQAGHFFGMTSPFQIHEIDKRLKREESGLQSLLDLYRGIRDGEWPVSLAEYDFFTCEIESTIETSIREGRSVETADSYHALKERPSPYLQSLGFAEFLEKQVVPKIGERTGVTSSRESPQPEPNRLLVSRSGQYCLISYSRSRGPNNRKTYYRGFCWDLESLKKEILPKIIGQVSRETGLEVENVNGIGTASSGGGQSALTVNSLVLPYRQFPLPWKLLAIQPELEQLEGAARRENFLHGALLAFILVLMSFGAFLLGRDISRESATTHLKMEFVHNISHELKTPLTLIRLYGETLQRKKNLTEEDRSESYEIITKESERLSHLINNVLDFSRIEMGRKEFKFRKDSLSRVVQETLDSYRYHLEKKGFEVFDQIDPHLPEVSFDAEAVVSILINLLSNAMKFSSDRKEVTVRLFRRDGWAVLQVEDKGIGIARQDQGEIFKKFYRVKQDVASQTQGSGLGLTLVKHITEAHGGVVEVESELAKGSVFSILLPLSGPGEADAK